MNILRNFIFGPTGERQSMAIEAGRVLWRDDRQTTEGEDLTGKTIWPSFIDSHCHILPMGLMMRSLPLDGCESHDEVLDRVRDRHNQLPSGDWLFGVFYDQTRFPDGAHITRHQLDAIDADRPMILRHVNGHASIANSAALKIAGVNRDTADPKGGEFVRDADGTPNGVLLESAHERVTASAPSPTLDEMVSAILAASESMAGYGIACATDMMTGRYDLRKELEAYQIAADRGPVRFRLCIQWRDLFGPRAQPCDDLIQQMNRERCAVWGAKIFADGAIGSATAAIYGDYEGQPGNDGMLMYAPDKFKSMVKTADDAGWRIAVHAIGDRATDLVMDAYDQTEDPTRHRIEHAMMLSDAQIERMATMGVHCAMQPEFLHRFGHAYKRQLGPSRAYSLKRFRSVLDAGIPLSFSSDRPIVPGGPRDGVHTAANRPEGFDSAENITLAEARRAYTEMGAVANADEHLMGRLEPGQLADYLVE